MVTINPKLDALSVPIADLTEDPANARTHSQRNIAAIASSLRRHGQQKPIVVNSKGIVIAGNGTLQAARDVLNWTEIAAVTFDSESATAQAQFAIEDNRTAELAEWDEDILLTHLRALEAEGADLEADLAFDESALKELEEAVNPTDKSELEDDEIPEDAPTRVKPGELWLLGDHRLMCGDSTDAGAVGRLLGDRKPFLMVTDPPYGVNYDPTWRQEAAEAGLIWAPAALGAVQNDDRDDWREAYALFPGVVAYVWHSGLHGGVVAEGLVDAKFEIRAQIIWRKSHLALSRGHYHWQHEPVLYVARGSAKWCGDRTQSTIWDIGHAKNESGHGTEKPLECMARPIRNHGTAEDDVYDPFLGSGTTIIAAEHLGRRCFGLEIDPKYCDVILARWEKLTGREAVRDE